MTLGAILGTIAIVAVTIAIGIFADRKLGLVPRPEQLAGHRPKLPGHAAGEAPSTAIRARGSQLATLRKTQRCKHCHAKLVAADDDHVRYDDRELVVLQFRCPDCGRSRSLYVAPDLQISQTSR